MKWVGRSERRLEDPSLVRGEGRFVADIAIGQRCVRFVRSPFANGRIMGISRPPGGPETGIVVTAEDLAGVKPITPLLHKFNYIAIDQPILAAGRVCYVGQAIAAVVADTPEAAEDLAEQVLVDIEPDDVVTDALAALRPGAAVVHDKAPANTLVEGNFRTPGCNAAFAGAAVVVEFALRSRRQNATPLEARGGCAIYDRNTRRVELFASTQTPHMMRTGIADCLGMAEADLRVVAPDVGGGFGQKMALFPEYVVLVWLARHLRSGVAWIEDRRENLIASAHSRDQHHFLRGAFDGDGKFLALDADIVANIGAYSCYPVTAGVEPLMALTEYPGPYRIGEYAARARGVTTHTCPMAPYRGVSRPPISFGIERLMDCAARKLNIDPIELRRRNLVEKFPYRTATGLDLDEASYIEAMDMMTREVDIPAFRARQIRARDDGRYLGLGISVINERTGYGTPAFAARGMEITPGWEVVDIAMNPSGDVEARIGASPHGQGLRTTLSQIIADQLGVAIQRVRIIHGDTDRTPYGWGTFASRSAVISGGACHLAAEKLARQIKRCAAQLLQSEAGKILLRDGKAVVEATGASIPLDSLARTVYHRSHLLPDVGEFKLAQSASYDPPGTFSNACHLAIVDVDVETGHVRIERYVVVEDAGRLINPMIVEGQIRGGIAQGIANALYEEIVYAEDGNILTSSLADYLLPTLAEIPEIEIHHLVTTSDMSITEAKGLGEGGAIGAPAAVINAICDALSPFGIEIFEMPATPDRIRAALRAAEGSLHA